MFPVVPKPSAHWSAPVRTGASTPASWIDEEDDELASVVEEDEEPIGSVEVELEEDEPGSVVEDEAVEEDVELGPVEELVSSEEEEVPELD